MSSQTVKPFSGYVVIEPIKEQTTSTGLIRTDETSRQTQRGVVVAVGDDLIEHFDTKLVTTKCQAKVGETVFFKKYSNQTIKVDEKEYEIVEFKDLIAKV